MRLIKLAAYSLLGYVLYELFVGITQEHDAIRERSGRGRYGRQVRQQDQLQPQDLRTSQVNQSSPAGSVPIQTQDPTGATGTRYVGRGVVQP